MLLVRSPSTVGFCKSGLGCKRPAGRLDFSFRKLVLVALLDALRVSLKGFALVLAVSLGLRPPRKMIFYFLSIVVIFVQITFRSIHF